jgi:hypothetical protein
VLFISDLERTSDFYGRKLGRDCVHGNGLCPRKRRSAVCNTENGVGIASFSNDRVQHLLLSLDLIGLDRVAGH